jgi:predicted DNA-binding protein (MmcQ/YjbR family)
MDEQTIRDYLLSFEGAAIGPPVDEGVATFEAGGKMFALLERGKTPPRLSLRCDSNLATALREQYETVMPGRRLHGAHWNTLVLSGQLSWPEVQDLIRHAYILVTDDNSGN